VIPADFIDEWGQQVPWRQDDQVEQDLVLSRALVELFSRDVIQGALAFRGGTALGKLYFSPPPRYSEDIDLVQVAPGGIGEVLDAVHSALDGWLGEPKWKQTHGRVTLLYRLQSSELPARPLKVKVEISTREHGSVHPLVRSRFAVESRWFSGVSEIPTYELDELMGTKLRALFQRKKGRDLFDLDFALRSGRADPARIVRCFEQYMAHAELTVSRAEFEQNLAQKRDDRLFTASLGPLLARPEEWDFNAAFDRVSTELVARLPGDPWAGNAAPRGTQ
jgi:predicted nucleotidyltransferase component of viral defense system